MRRAFSWLDPGDLKRIFTNAMESAPPRHLRMSMPDNAEHLDELQRIGTVVQLFK